MAARTAATVADAFAIFENFMAAYSPAISAVIRPLSEPGRSFFEFAILVEGLPPIPQTIELSLGVTLRVFRLMLGGDYAPITVHLPHEALTSQDDYRSYFGCPPRFAQRAAGFTLRSADLARPLNDDRLPHQAVVGYLSTITQRDAGITGRADWEWLTGPERDLATRLCAEFIAGEEAVTEDIQPFMSAMRAEGRLADEMYLTQFAFEEAKHTQVFRLWLDAVGISYDLQGYFDELPEYRKIFYEELPESLGALSSDPSPAAQVRASVVYNHVVEGMLALTGYYAWHKICVERGILPGMQQLVRRIGDDERRHMAWGTFTCRRHVAADDANWTVFETRMNELIPLALRSVEEFFARYGGQIPFNLSVEEFIQYSSDKGLPAVAG